MKLLQESAKKTATLFIFLLLVLQTGCADVRGPTWLTGEPDEEVLSAPRAVAVPSGAAKTTWPNLADVPEKKPVFTPQSQHAAQVEDMTSDKLKGQADLERLRNVDLSGASPTDNGVPTAFGVSPTSSVEGDSQ